MGRILGQGFCKGRTRSKGGRGTSLDCQHLFKLNCVNGGPVSVRLAGQVPLVSRIPGKHSWSRGLGTHRPIPLLKSRGKEASDTGAMSLGNKLVI